MCNGIMGEGKAIDEGIFMIVLQCVLLLFGALLRVLLPSGISSGARFDVVLRVLLDALLLVSSCDIHAPAAITIFFVVYVAGLSVCT